MRARMKKLRQLAGPGGGGEGLAIESAVPARLGPEGEVGSGQLFAVSQEEITPRFEIEVQTLGESDALAG